jgi:hypothetical protein
MSMYRKFYISSWNDKDFRNLDALTHELWIYLNHYPYSNKVGIFLFQHEVAILYLLPKWRQFLEDFGAWDDAVSPAKFRALYFKSFQKLRQAGLIEYHEPSQVIFVCGFLRQEPPASFKNVQSWGKVLDELPNDHPFLPNIRKLLTEIFSGEAQKLCLEAFDNLEAVKNYITSKCFEAAKPSPMLSPIASPMPSQEQEQEQEQERYSTVVCSSSVGAQRLALTAPANEKNTVVDEGEVIDLTQTVLLTIPLKDGTHSQITQQMIANWNQIYPGLDVMQKLLRIREWNINNPLKRKTRRGILQHITNWLSDDYEQLTQHKTRSTQYANHRPQSKADILWEACKGGVKGTVYENF